MSPAIAILEWFRPGEYAQVERVLSDLKAIGVCSLRTGVSWADWHSAGGQDWYAGLLPRLAQEVEVVPCFHYPPPSLGMVPKTSSPPRRPRDYADFIDRMITDFDSCFEWVELWNEPNNLCDWDWRRDPQGWIFCERVGAAAYWAQQRGKKTLLAGMALVDPYWLGVIADRGVLQYIDNPQVWITETGFSTGRHDEYSQLQCFVEAIAAPVERVYGYSCYDLYPDLPSQEGFHVDERHYHTGLKRQDGTAKLLYRIWATEGLESVIHLAQTDTLMVNSTVSTHSRSDSGFTSSLSPVVILGGPGFIGTHLAHRLARDGQPVVIFDNLSRPGSEQNLRQLCETWGELVQVTIADLRDRYRLRHILQETCAVYHLASPPPSPAGHPDPLGAFEVTAWGMLYLLEELRSLPHPPPVIYTSTTAVYGPGEQPDGFREDHPLKVPPSDACAQSTAEQYAINYARSFGIPAIVLRLGAIYGPSLRGTADVLSDCFSGIVGDREIGGEGEGKVVRDWLYLDDLVDELLLAQENAPAVAGSIFNLGGGPENALTELELIQVMGEICGKQPSVKFAANSQGTLLENSSLYPPYEVCNTTKFQTATGWSPQTSLPQGLEKIYHLLLEREESTGPKL